MCNMLRYAYDYPCVMAGIRDTDTKRKLLALSLFPTSQQAINICRSEESAKANEKSLSNPPAVSYVQTKSQRPFRPSETGRFGSCDRSTHRNGEPCPAFGKQCHKCGENNHFSPCCPKKPKAEATIGGGKQKGTHSGNKQGEHSDQSRVHMKRIVVGNFRAHRTLFRVPGASSTGSHSRRNPAHRSRDRQGVHRGF